VRHSGDLTGSVRFPIVRVTDRRSVQFGTGGLIMPSLGTLARAGSSSELDVLASMPILAKGIWLV